MVDIIPIQSKIPEVYLRPQQITISGSSKRTVVDAYIGTHARDEDDRPPTVRYHVSGCLTGGIEHAVHIDIKQSFNTISGIAAENGEGVKISAF